VSPERAFWWKSSNSSKAASQAENAASKHPAGAVTDRAALHQGPLLDKSTRLPASSGQQADVKDQKQVNNRTAGTAPVRRLQALVCASPCKPDGTLLTVHTTVGFAAGNAVDALHRLSKVNPQLFEALLTIEKGYDGRISTGTLAKIQAAMDPSAEPPAKKVEEVSVHRSNSAGAPERPPSTESSASSCPGTAYSVTWRLKTASCPLFCALNLEQ
jgi:hypothetical protein